MPTTDALQPPLTPAEQVLVRSYGGWSQFLTAFGLKPSEQEDVEDGKLMLEAFIRDEEENAKRAKAAKAARGAKGAKGAKGANDSK